MFMATQNQMIDPNWRSLTTTKRDILIALGAHGPLTGAELTRGIPDIHEKRVYKHLPDLREQGLVTYQGNRNARKNDLTDAGNELLFRALSKKLRNIATDA